MPRPPRPTGTWSSLLSLVALVLFLGVVWWLGRDAPPSARGPAVEVGRLGDDDLVASPAAIATSTQDGADEVLLLSTWQNGAAAAFAAGALDAPILFGERTDLPDPLLPTIIQLAPDEVLVIGGEPGIGQPPVNILQTAGFEVRRVGGEGDRYTTAADVARELAGSVGTIGGRRTAILAGDEAPAQVVSAGPLAAGARLPLLVSPPTAAEPVVLEVLQELGIEQLIAVGDEAAIADTVLDVYREAGLDVERVGEADPAATAARMADYLRERLGWSAETVVLGVIDRHTDAIAASRHAGEERAPILLVPDHATLGDATEAWLTQQCDVTRIEALGGIEVITDELLQAAADAAATCEAEDDQAQDPR